MNSNPAPQVGGTDTDTGGTDSYVSRGTGRLSALKLDLNPADGPRSRWPVAYLMVAAYLVVGLILVGLTDPVARLLTGSAPDGNAHTAVALLFVILSSAAFAAAAVWFRRRIRRVYHKLQERDAHVGRIIDTMANGVALIDPDGTIVDANPALAELLGVDQSELIGRTLAPIPADDGDDDEMTPASGILKMARRDGQWSGELKRRHSNGRQIPIHLTLAPLYDDHNRLTGFVGDYLDLRDIKAAEQHLDGLGAVIEQLASETSLDVVGNKAIAAAMELTDTELGGAVVLDDDYNQLEHRWLHGFPDHIDAPLPAKRPDLVGRVIEHRAPRVVPDLDDTSRRLALYEQQDARGVVAAPIEVGGLIRGALVVGTCRPLDEMPDRHIPLLEAIARQIGVALHRHELLQDARHSEARFRNLVNSVPDILYTVELPDFSTEFISPSVHRLLGIDPDEFLANPTLWRELIHDDDIDHVDRSISRVIDDDGEEYSLEYRAWNHDHSRFYWVEDRGRIHRDDQGEPTALTGTISDITARKEAEDRLAYLAFNDRLTGLPNRFGLLERLDDFFDAPTRPPAILLYCDLDRFHLVNDIHGHDSGNELLVETARRLEQTIPASATLARIGADEFVIFIPVDQPPHPDGGEQTLDRSALETRARDHVLQVMAAFRKPFTIREQPSYLSTTVGIGLTVDDIDDPRSLMKNAHRALAHAKETGPANFAFYAGELAERQQRRLSLQSQLHRGLDNDEFRLHYQPIVDLKSGSVVGAEALLRWTTPDGQFISPGEFIPVAEQSGLIIPLGDWVMQQACRDLGRWLDDGLDLSVSLNLSPRQFYHLDIVDRIHSAAKDAGVAPGRLELELTESDMLVDPEETAQILTSLRHAGFSVAIDDFGTGYSSLQRLHHLPVQTLKIDRSFISQLPDEGHDDSIVDIIISLAANFDMTSLAEGIETRHQWKLLTDLGCHYGQGYYFSRPVPADEFVALCQSRLPWNQPATTAG